MKWRVFFGCAVLGALGYAAYACTSDTFTGDGGADGAGDAAGPATQAEFCDAEATYYAHCNVDAACATTNITNCGSLFAYLSPAFATAVARCMEQNQLDCNATFSSVASSPCVQTELAGTSNGGSAFNELATDFCKWCGTTQSCVASFGASDQPGYAASLFSDPVINQIDKSCTPKTDASAANSDGGLTCAQDFELCEYIVLGLMLPKNACQDGGF